MHALKSVTVIEHDGSLSRNDIYFGDNHSFNAKIWESVAVAFTNTTISIPTAAKARVARLQAAAAANPEFNLTADGTQFSFIETALYLSVFGNLDDGNANTEWVKVLFSMFDLAFSLPWFVCLHRTLSARTSAIPGRVLKGKLANHCSRHPGLSR